MQDHFCVNGTLKPNTCSAWSVLITYVAMTEQIWHLLPMDDCHLNSVSKKVRLLVWFI